MSFGGRINSLTSNATNSQTQYNVEFSKIIASLNGRLAVLENSNNSFNPYVTDISNNAADIIVVDSRVDATNDSLDALTTRLSNDESIITSQANSLSDLTSVVASLTSLANYDLPITNLQGNVVLLQNRASSLESNVTSLQGNVTMLQTRAGLLESNVTSNSNSIILNTSNITLLQTRAGLIESNINILQGNVISNSNSISLNSSNINILQGNVISNSNSITLNNSNINILQGNVTTLETRAGSLESNVTILQYRPIDTQPISGSSNVITSGGVFSAVGSFQSSIDNNTSNITTLYANSANVLATNTFTTTNNFSRFTEAVTPITGNSIVYSNTNGVIVSTVAAGTYQWGVSSLPTTTANISYTMTVLFANKSWANTFTVNGTTVVAKAVGGLTNLTPATSATSVLQTITYYYTANVGVANVNIITGIQSLY